MLFAAVNEAALLKGLYVLQVSNMTVTWEQLGWAENQVVHVRDLFGRVDLPPAVNSCRVGVDVHDTRLLRLQPAKGMPSAVAGLQTRTQATDA